MTVHAKTALLGPKWVRDLRVEVEHGRITKLEQSSKPQQGDTCVDVLLPALANLHSHAFQRAMAGMTETRAAGRESFWTWRTLMYRFLDRLNPEQIEAIAALVFMEMQEAGYASVGEFHYVHHQPGGTPYAQLSELSQRIFSAANQTGIGLTHLPVLYTYGGVTQEPLAGGQLRFGNDVDSFLRLVEDCDPLLPDADSQIGIAPHSLRATSPDDLRWVLDQTPEGPVHIHISEQVQEVADVEAALGQRPVEWLLNNADVNERWCLIHATHMTDDETRALAQSGAVAGLCPITEANLGDGIFNGAVYTENNGAFGVGSDSNVRISLPEELRTLEYSQRLRDKARTVLVQGEGSVGQSLYTGAARGGAQALGREAGEIALGQLADMVAIDRSHPTLCSLRDDQLLDGLSFAAPDGTVTDLWSAGRHQVRDGRHIARDSILTTYRAAMTDLLADI
ncbi:formimidoylglutamate deiminase [uncultured Ruegeria sp.]|uniref:formimidoylglutamate deiminase n=1 Tax=uncultured Ruegeria sp. TaxID=259304 RepID=UPI002633F9AF|nr:formimidoylglutamate deiminase [uncultured Ruegeria sp.]